MVVSEPAAAAPAMSFFPSPSSSSSDFEFTVSASPAASRRSCPADELFYKGQLLPLHPSPRIYMVRALLLSSASTSSSSTATSRNSTASSSSAFSAADLLLLPDSCNSSSRPSSVAENDAGRLPASAAKPPAAGGGTKYLSSLATRFSSAFLHRGGSKKLDSVDVSPAAPLLPVSKRAKEVIKKYVKKMRPIYEILPVMQQRNKKTTTFSFSDLLFSGKKNTPAASVNAAAFSQSSFSGNLLGRHPQARKKRWAASCPSSMRSSPSHSGLLYAGDAPPALSLPPSSMEELQSAIQGAIAHCKSSMMRSANHDEIATRS